MLHRIQARLLGEWAWKSPTAGPNPLVFRRWLAHKGGQDARGRLAGEGHSAEVTITMRHGWVAAKFASKSQTPAAREAG